MALQHILVTGITELKKQERKRIFADKANEEVIKKMRNLETKFGKMSVECSDDLLNVVGGSTIVPFHFHAHAYEHVLFCSMFTSNWKNPDDKGKEPFRVTITIKEDRSAFWKAGDSFVATLKEGPDYNAEFPEQKGINLKETTGQGACVLSAEGVGDYITKVHSNTLSLSFRVVKQLPPLVVGPRKQKRPRLADAQT